jgi:hypothetical protein
MLRSYPQDPSGPPEIFGYVQRVIADARRQVQGSKGPSRYAALPREKSMLETRVREPRALEIQGAIH